MKVIEQMEHLELNTTIGATAERRLECRPQVGYIIGLFRMLAFGSNEGVEIALLEP